MELPPLALRAEVASINEQKRTVSVILSTGSGVERFDWLSGKRFIEKLSMKPEHVKLDRLNSGAPLLDSHSAWSVGDILGVIEPGTARIEKSQLVATVRFSERPAVDPVWTDVRTGIIRSLSIGYRVARFEEEEAKNQLPVRTATDWTPFEASLVAMPADIGAKVRSDKSQTNECVIVRADQDADRIRRFKLASARMRFAS